MHVHTLNIHLPITIMWLSPERNLITLRYQNPCNCSLPTARQNKKNQPTYSQRETKIPGRNNSILKTAPYYLKNFNRTNKLTKKLNF